MASSDGNSVPDELVQSVNCYVEKPIFLHGYVLFCVPLYAMWAYLWIVSGFVNSFEFAMIGFAGIGVIQILMMLSCVWSVRVRCLMTCSREPDAEKASVAEIVPQPNQGSSELVRLIRKREQITDVDSSVRIWFTFQKVQYVYDATSRNFQRPTFPIADQIRTYRDSKGLIDEKAAVLERTFGKNRLEMYAPSFKELFQERATAPFFVFQVFCVGLWCLDEYWYYSLFTLFMLVAFEATLVQQQLRNLSEIRKMGHKPYNLQVYRNRRWRQISSEELLPGDIVSLTRRADEDKPVPADFLLLRGSCVVDESLLTGESVPQMKECIESLDDEEALDLNSHGRLHVIYGGTKIVQHSGPGRGEKDTGGITAPDNGVICYVLRTGFNTSQGSLLRTIMFGVKRVTANNKETFAFILFLLAFAISASGYLWIEGSKDEKRSKYKLFLECTLILTSVVPPELPIELSLAVNTSLVALVKLGTYCTEPFRIPFGGKVDFCCFDKTGTLTSDTLIVEGVAGVKSEGNDGLSNDKLISADKAPWETIQVLASCHSLVLLEDKAIGDPLEKVTLDSLAWNITKADAVVPKKGKMPGIKIYQRFHFSSALKRMSVIAGFSESGSTQTEFFAAVKGAPETIRSMLRTVPDKYDEIYLHHAHRGARVLALGKRNLGSLQLSAIRNLRRADVEHDLEFVGFLVISTPLRPESKDVCKELAHASHHITMITGDNALTACYVASELGFCAKNTLVFEPETSLWRSIDEQITVPLNDLFASKLKDNLCLTGAGLDWMMRTKYPKMSQVLPKIKVFARFTPSQKEFVVNELKRLGFVTLMCGDGTNDVGALKHAHVGVALLQKVVVSGEKLKSSYTDASSETLVPLTLPVRQVESQPAMQQDRPPKKKGPPRLTTKSEPSVAAANRAMTPVEQRMQQVLQQLQDEDEVTVVKLGDASVAAPFSSKIGSVRSVCDIIKQGRCTLVTTLQMFKILALNALILAYSQSVLYLKGVKFSDTQATIQGIFLAACFLFISRSKPLTVLSKQRPLPNIFNFYTILTVFGQFVIHFGCLVFLVTETLGKYYSLPDELDLEADFKPNLLNSVVYLMSMTLQVSTFLVNYRGRPFMESLRENRPLMYSIAISLGFLFMIASNSIPDVQEQFQIVPIPDEFVPKVVGALALDIVAAWSIDRFLMLLFGEGRLKKA